MTDYIVDSIISKLKGELWNWLSGLFTGLNWMSLVIAVVAIAVAYIIVAKLVKKLGMLALIAAAGVAGAGIFGIYFSKDRVIETPRTVTLPPVYTPPVYVDRVVEKPVRDEESLNEMARQVESQRREKERLAREKERLARELAETQERLAASRRTSQPGTRAELADSFVINSHGGRDYPPDAAWGYCGYCHATLVISGNKGNDTIRCPACGATMTALQAIMYKKKVDQRGYFVD